MHRGMSFHWVLCVHMSKANDRGPAAMQHVYMGECKVSAMHT